MSSKDGLSKTVMHLADVIWHEHYRGIISDEQIDYMVDNFQSEEAILKDIENGYEYRLIMDGDKEVGYCSFHLEGDSVYLSKIYVMKEYRGRGHGRKTFEMIADYARSSGAKTIYLRVNRGNVDSIKAYEASGFRKKGEDVAPIGNGFVMDDYIMEKDVF